MKESLEVFKLDTKHIGKNITKLMNENGITQRDLAKQTGLAESTISRYTTGKRIPSLDNLLKIADAFDTDIYTFL